MQTEELKRMLREKSINILYIERYIKFIFSRTRQHTNKCEKHHILPKSEDFWPEYSKSKWNIIILTQREHFIAHLLLAKGLGGSQIYASWAMCNKQSPKHAERHFVVSSRTYDIMKRDFKKKFTEENIGFLYIRNDDGTTTKMSKEEFKKSGKQNNRFGMIKMKNIITGERKDFTVEERKKLDEDTWVPVNAIGFYHTPVGKSSTDYNKELRKKIGNYGPKCKNPDSILDINHTKGKGPLAGHEGKTFRELGFWFEPFLDQCWDEILEVEEIDYEGDVYNLHVEDNHNYYAGNILVSNCHTYKASEVRGTIEQFRSTVRRIGTTGTLDNSKVNELVLTGLMGTPYQVKTTRQLMDEGVLTDIRIQILKLKYPDHVCKAMKGADYDTEIDFIVGSQERNRFIVNLALKCKGATLITFAYVERHGRVIFDMLKEKAGDRKVYFVYGKTDVETREEIRKLVNQDPDSIVVASEKIFSTGTNIPGLTNVIFAMPRKSQILIRQTIGRGVRKFEGKNMMNLFDIADDFTTSSRRNHGLRALAERMTIYIKEEFEYAVFEINMDKYLKS